MLPKIDWVVLGGLALGGIVGVFMLHSIVPVVAKPAERVVTAVVVIVAFAIAYALGYIRRA